MYKGSFFMLEIEMIRFTAQDILTTSVCACTPGDQDCERLGHPDCHGNPQQGHLCGLGEA